MVCCPEVLYSLLLPHRKREREVWDGRVLSLDAAKDVFGADEVAELNEESLVSMLSSKIKGATSVLLDRDRPCPILTRCLPESLKVSDSVF